MQIFRKKNAKKINIIAYFAKNEYLCSPKSRFMRKFIVFLSIVYSSLLMAQVAPVQRADNSFFDPTRKQVVEEEYHFGVEYRLEVGYIQNHQRSTNLTYPDIFLHGARAGATFTFLLPRHFSMQVGALYSLAYGVQEQHWRSQDAPSVQNEYIRHRILEHNLTVPVRCFYNIPLWKQLNMFFYGGPQLQIGMAENDYMQTHLSVGTEQWLQSQGIHTEEYDRMQDELLRANFQLGVGGGFEWDRYRLQAGYDFGLNNLVLPKSVVNRQMWEWGWYTSFSYRF